MPLYRIDRDGPPRYRDGNAPGQVSPANERAPHGPPSEAPVLETLRAVADAAALAPQQHRDLERWAPLSGHEISALTPQQEADMIADLQRRVASLEQRVEILENKSATPAENVAPRIASLEQIMATHTEALALSSQSRTEAQTVTDGRLTKVEDLLLTIRDALRDGSKR